MLRKRAYSVAWGPVLGVLVGVFTLALGGPRPVGAQGYLYVDNDGIRQCGGRTPCHTTIQGAVDAASPGDTVFVYPGHYVESVDLNRMDPDGAIGIVTVDAAGSPLPGTVSMDRASTGGVFYTSSPFDGDVTIVGFSTAPSGNNVRIEVEGAGSAARDVEIRHVAIVSGDIRVRADGDVIIAECDVSGYYGTMAIGVWSAGGNVEISNSTAANTFFGGFLAQYVQGDVTITNCTAYNNSDQGIFVDHVSGDVTISRCTTDLTGYDGVNVGHLAGDLEISGCLVTRNGASGILFDYDTGGAVEVHGNIICENGWFGVELPSRDPLSVSAEGNWWGCAGGPDDEECDSAEEGIGSVDYTPWIDTISADTGGSPVVAGQPMVVRLRFSDSNGTVFLGPGPGDPNGPPPFTVSTDNGILNREGSTVGGFIEGTDGVLEVTLVPERTGVATLTVVGPCGLEKVITLQGPTAEEEFVPEPGAVLLLGSGLMGLTGYATLRLRRR